MLDLRSRVHAVACLPPGLIVSIGLHTAAVALAIGVPQLWPWALGAVALDQAALTAATLSPRSALLGPNLRRLPARGGTIVLSFDDGPDPEVTPRVLDLLDGYHARASFFCIGMAARANPGLVREIIRRGHSVENHTHRHPYYFALLPPRLLQREIIAAQCVLTELAGTRPRFFRAPMGFRSPLLQPILAGQHLRLVSWTRRAGDGLLRDPAAADARLRRGLGEGDLLLLHDGRAARGPNGEAVVLSVLPRLLQGLAARGLRSVSLAEALPAAQAPG